MWDLARPAIGDKLNQAIRSIKLDQRTTQLTTEHFFKTTDLDYITMHVKIMTIIFNISPYFVFGFFPCQIVAIKTLSYINGHCYVSV